MITTPGSFLGQTASDLMSRSLVLVPREMSLPGAARLLGKAHVTGAPVVDERGRCIGVISTTDFLTYAEHGGHLKKSGPHSVCSWQILDSEESSHDKVEDFMNKDPVMVPPATGIGDLARAMIDAHIHRVVVVDEGNRPIGIVSSTDILAAVAQAHTRGL
jgi:predicted transcriptional regulator